jgi:SAM-dependent methyltransferase
LTQASKDTADAERAALGCPACGTHAPFAFAAQDLNRAISSERFDYHRCPSCGIWLIAAIPDDLSRYYPPEYYSPISAQTLDALAASERPKLDMLLDRIEPGRLVEIGPGDGLFARAARNHGFEVTAIEMDRGACEHLESTVGVRAIASDAPEKVLPALPPSRAIVMWHVIEHLPRPMDVISAAAGNLEPGGLLVIATPNPDAIQFKLLKARWAHLDAPRHLFLIPSGTLRQRCELLGMRELASTTSDPAGRHWNWFGWEYAFRAPPRCRPASLPWKLASRLLTLAASPIEGSGQRGCAYTSVFVKQARDGGPRSL